MKRIFIMLLIVSSAITTTSAEPTAAPQKKPVGVIATLNAIIQKFGMNEGQIFSVNRNPNTGIMESSTKIVPFSCPTNDIKNDNVLNAVSINFQKEEPLSYQFQHIQPGSNENIYLMVIDNDGKSNNVRIRSNKRQEMWMMCTKNPENPQLRDAYAVTWELSEDKQKTVGTVYMITSLRPDLYEKNHSAKSQMEPQSIGSEDIVEDTVVIIGSDDIVEDTVMIDTIPGYSEPVTPRQSSRWEPTPEQKMQVEAKAMAVKANMDAIKATYASLETYFKMKSLTGTDPIFAQITKLNKELDAKFQDFIKYLKGLDVPPTEKAEKTNTIGDIYKEFLKFYTEQNQGFTEMYKEVGVLTKAAQKTQKYINGLTEKYLKEMSKAVMGTE